MPVFCPKVVAARDVACWRGVASHGAEAGIDRDFRGARVRNVECARTGGIERDLVGRIKAGVASCDHHRRGYSTVGRSGTGIDRDAGVRGIAHNQSSRAINLKSRG